MTVDILNKIQDLKNVQRIASKRKPQTFLRVVLCLKPNVQVWVLAGSNQSQFKDVVVKLTPWDRPNVICVWAQFAVSNRTPASHVVMSYIQVWRRSSLVHHFPLF